MKTFVALMTAVLLVTATSYAQDYDYGYQEPAMHTTLTIAPELAVPIGDFSDGYKLGYGGIVSLGFGFTPNVEASVTSGYTWVNGDKVSGTKVDNAALIPVMAGLRFLPVPNMYIGAQAGMNGFNGHASVNNVSALGTNSWKWKFAAAPEVGFRTTMGGVGADLSGTYNWTNDYQYIGARLGLTVGSW